MLHIVEVLNKWLVVKINSLRNWFFFFYCNPEKWFFELHESWTPYHGLQRPFMVCPNYFLSSSFVSLSTILSAPAIEHMTLGNVIHCGCLILFFALHLISFNSAFCLSKSIYPLAFHSGVFSPEKSSLNLSLLCSLCIFLLEPISCLCFL